MENAWENGVLLVTQIQNGYRMAKPEYAPNFIGEMMKNCWQRAKRQTDLLPNGRRHRKRNRVRCAGHRLFEFKWPNMEMT